MPGDANLVKLSPPIVTESNSVHEIIIKMNDSSAFKCLQLRAGLRLINFTYFSGNAATLRLTATVISFQAKQG